MDGTTESVIAVIGCPIAGNPAQFALERAFESMNLDWRVLSFEVRPEKIGAALDGIEVLGIRGVHADRDCSSLVAQWCRQRGDSAEVVPATVDCLYRPDPDGDGLEPDSAHERWLAASIDQHFKSRGRVPRRALWLDPSMSDATQLPLDGLEIERCDAAPEPEQVESADLIVLAGTSGDATALETSRWPARDPSQLVVDLTDLGHPDAADLVDAGWQLLSSEDRQRGTLLNCIRRWTGRDASGEVVQDAIEEYLAV